MYVWVGRGRRKESLNVCGQLGEVEVGEGKASVRMEDLSVSVKRVGAGWQGSEGVL